MSDETPSPRPTRRLRRWALVAVGVVAAYYLVNLVQVWTVGRSDQARRVDAIVVLGAAEYDGRPSPQLTARLDQALTLFREGYAELVVVTGGNQPGDRFTEAQASERYLVAEGVPADAIRREDSGTTSYESLRNVARLLTVEGLDRVLLVSDPFHSLRIRLVAQELGLTAYVSPTRTSPVRGMAVVVRELKEAAGVAVGRIIGFSRLPT